MPVRMPVTTEYRNSSKFSVEVFREGLDQELNKGIICNSQDKKYNLISDFSNKILNHQAPLKTKRIRGN